MLKKSFLFSVLIAVSVVLFMGCGKDDVDCKPVESGHKYSIDYQGKYVGDIIFTSNSSLVGNFDSNYFGYGTKNSYEFKNCTLKGSDLILNIDVNGSLRNTKTLPITDATFDTAGKLTSFTSTNGSAV